MTSDEIRNKYLAFFEEKGHVVVPSASLVPDETDPTVLFTTAGMHPLVPYLLGEKHSSGKKRLASVQKCIRTADISEVGDASHLTFFEMLGNWSLGDYFKEGAINMSWEFLTNKKWLDLNKDKLAISVFEGDNDAPFDKEAFDLWQKHGMPEERIAKLPKKDNWWGPAGETGPCGPDTEMFYWTGDESAPEKFDPNDSRWVEIWNDVFMEYNKKEDGSYESLSQKNVDTGMGLERVAMIMQKKDDVYEIDTFKPIIDKINEFSTSDDLKAKRIIADHIKAAVFIIADGVIPSNTGRGYVLRRLIRRARYYCDSIGAKKMRLGYLAGCVVSIYKNVYPELGKAEDKIDKVVIKEENTFCAHLGFGKKLLEKIIEKEKHISGKNAFLLYSTYGFPFELVLDIAKENNIKVDEDDFNKRKTAHQKLSRTASAGMFKGGLADSSEETTKLHTATHLLLAALRQVLGSHIEQRGSNITEKRLRLDFAHPEKLTDEEKQKIEDLINQKIKEDLEIICEEMSPKEAKNKGALGIFEHKYDGKVKVYSIDSFSREICGGPHVEKTGELGNFKIIKEEASSAGIRRIKAVLVQ